MSRRAGSKCAAVWVSVGFAWSCTSTPTPTDPEPVPATTREYVALLYAPHGAARVVALNERLVTGREWPLEAGSQRIWIRFRDGESGDRVMRSGRNFCGYGFEAMTGDEIRIEYRLALDTAEDPDRFGGNLDAVETWLFDQNNRAVRTRQLGCFIALPSEITE